MKRFLSLLMALCIAATSLTVVSFADSAKSFAELYDVDISVTNTEGVTFEQYIIDSLRAYKSSIDISVFSARAGWDADAAMRAYQAVLYTNPELFYVDASIGWSYSSSSGTKLTNVSYNIAQSKLSKAISKFDAAVDKALAVINEKMTDVEKALAIHDYIILNCAYDTTYSKRTAYNCLVEGSSVCQGYSLAYAYIMNNELGIDCRVISSTSMNHSWNYIKLDGKWYHTDLTFDDPLNANDEDSYGHVGHDYFLLSDSAIKKAEVPHTGWERGSMPKATSTKYNNYFWRNVNSAIVYVNGNWYYTVMDEESPCLNAKVTKSTDMYTLLMKANVNKNSAKSIYSVTSTWYVWGKNGTSKSWYSDSYSSIAAKGNYLYFNGAEYVYKYKIGSDSASKIIMANDGYIYGLTLSGSKLSYNVTTEPAGELNVSTQKL